MEEIKFDEKEHGFEVGGRKMPSVTKILSATGISPDYSGLDPAYAEYGRKMHSELEWWFKSGEGEGFHIDNIQNWMGNLKGLPDGDGCYDNGRVSTETKLVSSLGYCGIADLALVLADGTAVLCDYKTGKADAESVRWQLSMYAEAYEEMTGRKVTALWVIEKIATEDEVRWYTVERVKRESIATLMDEFARGESHGENLEIIPELQKARAVELLESLAVLEMRKKDMESSLSAVKESIVKAMKDNDVKSFDTEGFHFTLKAASVQNRVDSTKLKNEHPDIYAECLKETKVAESLLIKKIAAAEVDA